MAGAAAAAAMQALRASGPIVRIEPSDFTLLVFRMEEPLVVTAVSRLFKRSHRYLTCYKGMFFCTRSAEPLQLGARTEVVRARRIWIPW
jgi:hypothetical protein